MNIKKILQNWLCEKPVQVKIPAKRKAKKRKPRDSTRITQYMHDYVNYAYTQWVKENETGLSRRTQQELVQQINAKMGTDKSLGVFSRIWKHKTKRESLPKGKAYFEYK